MMRQHNSWVGWLKKLTLVSSLVIPLAGCLSLEEDSTSTGISGSTSTATAPASVSTAATDVVIAGSVGDGPVTGATITVYSIGGDVLGSFFSDNAASFRSTLKVKGNQYPLRLVVSGGTDLVTGMAPDFEMLSVMLKPSDRQVNINPFTTMIVQLAEKLPGGLNTANVDAARPVVLDQLGFGLDPGIIQDPITTLVDDGNVAHLLKASEAMGEMVRRTRDLIKATGKSATGDSVVRALAADLSDGVVDGLGAMGANPTVAAVANVVSGQVLVEALSNNLRVGGVVATSVIDQSILVTRSGTGTFQLTDSVAINSMMIEQTRIAIAAARVLDAGSELQNVDAAVSSLAAGSLPGDVASLLPADSSLVLDNAVNLVATAGTTEISTINLVVASGGVTSAPVVNTPPAISGAPAGSVTANNVYQFQPGASDSDGDSLTFSISNKPSWASFNMSTGRLSGTPTDAQVGSYGGIVISVTDGTDTSSLTAFSIQVNAAPVTNTAPTISGTPATSVTAANSYQFQPASSDVDGDTLSFSIANKPVWASFSTSTGRLSGTPAGTQVGTYGGITISVTDGTDTSSLAAFSIQVNPAPVQTGNLSLNWVAPATRSDGTPLSLADIGGYRIRYGTTTGSYPNTVNVTDGSATSATVTNLPVGTYYVVMTTYDTSGLESSNSATAVKTVP